jgi:hypothetical protein
MRMPIIAAFFPLLLTCCVAESPLKEANSNAAAKDQAQMSYLGCITSRISETDDGRSDPLSVAVGVNALCATEGTQVVHAYCNEMPMSVQLECRQGIRNVNIETTTGAVMKSRANQSIK